MLRTRAGGACSIEVKEVDMLYISSTNGHKFRHPRLRPRSVSVWPLYLHGQEAGEKAGESLSTIECILSKMFRTLFEVRLQQA